MSEFEYKNPYEKEENNNPYQQEENNNPYQQEGNTNPYTNPYGSNSSTSEEADNSTSSDNPYTNPYLDTNTYGVINNVNISQPVEKGGKGLAVASMILGILSTTCCCCSLIGFFFALAALIMGIIAQRRSRSGMALAGIITGSFGLAFGIIGIAFTLISGFFADLIAAFTAAFEEIINGSYIEDSSSSFNNNNNAIINVFNLVKRFLNL